MNKSSCQILDGRALASQILRQVRQEIVKNQLKPALAVILVGDDPASKTYVSLKQKACFKCGVEFYLYQLPKDAPEDQIIECLDFLNHDSEIHGIIVQLPMSKHLDEDKVISKINFKKDADGFHPKNLQLISAGKPHITPALHQGIIKLLEETKENLKDKNIAVISNNPVFASPLKYLAKAENCVWISPEDKTFQEKTLKADIVIIAIGQPKFLKAKMIKKDALIIDVGYNRVKDKPVGDVDFKSCAKKASFISPVPGGVGPMTVAMLLANTVKLYKLQQTATRNAYAIHATHSP